MNTFRDECGRLLSEFDCDRIRASVSSVIRTEGIEGIDYEYDLNKKFRIISSYVVSDDEGRAFMGFVANGKGLTDKWIMNHTKWLHDTSDNYRDFAKGSADAWNYKNDKKFIGPSIE